MTPKETDLLRQVIAHLRGMEKQSAHMTEAGNACVYWNPETESWCAVGCLIKPEHYSEEMEGNDLNHSRVQSALKASIGFDPSASFHHQLLELQRIHDDEYAWDEGGLSRYGEERLAAVEASL